MLPQGRCKADSVVLTDRNRGNGHKLKNRRFSLNTRKCFFAVRVTEHWDRLSREVPRSPSLDTQNQPEYSPGQSAVHGPV